jgi:hypothetical protein
MCELISLSETIINCFRGARPEPRTHSALGNETKHKFNTLSTKKSKAYVYALLFLVETTGFVPLAARPGKQSTGLFSLRFYITINKASVRKLLTPVRTSTLESRRFFFIPHEKKE